MRAREDPFFFVDNRLRYRDPDEAAFWSGGEEALDRLLALLGATVGPDQVVVDIGCGVGRLTRPLARRAARVIAIDVSSEMLAEARRLNSGLENVDWVHGDGESLRPVADASVDVCVSHVVFRHIPDPRVTFGYIREMGRVLRAGGFAAFEFSNDPEVHRVRPASRRQRVAMALRRAPRGTADGAWLGSYLEVDDVRKAAGAAALAVERTIGESTDLCLMLLRRRER